MTDDTKGCIVMACVVLALVAFIAMCVVLGYRKDARDAEEHRAVMEMFEREKAHGAK